MDSLGSFATVYVTNDRDVAGIYRAAARRSWRADGAAARGTRAGSSSFQPIELVTFVICADRDTVLGTQPADHDLSVLRAPLRSHGGLDEQGGPDVMQPPVP